MRFIGIVKAAKEYEPGAPADAKYYGRDAPLQ